jgi:hypothetical protein
MPHICATKFLSLIANCLFSMTLPERASGLLLNLDLAIKMEAASWADVVYNNFITLF